MAPFSASAPLYFTFPFARHRCAHRFEWMSGSHQFRAGAAVPRCAFGEKATYGRAHTHTELTMHARQTDAVVVRAWLTRGGGFARSPPAASPDPPAATAPDGGSIGQPAERVRAPGGPPTRRPPRSTCRQLRPPCMRTRRSPPPPPASLSSGASPRRGGQGGAGHPCCSGRRIDIRQACPSRFQAAHFVSPRVPCFPSAS